MIDINELRRLAQAATPGPWHATKSVETNSWAVWSDTTRLMELRPTKTVDMYRVSNTAAFIAAANPAAITELLDRLEAAESDGLEQSRLNGMGGEREAALLSKLEAAEKERDALRAKIEEMERQEPVAWLHETRRDSDVVTDAVKHVWGRVAVGSMAEYSIPLYTLPGAQPAPNIPDDGFKECITRAVTLAARKANLYALRFGDDDARRTCLSALVDELCGLFKVQLAPSVPAESIGKMLAQVMEAAVANGANSVSMPDELVEVAAWLSGAQPNPANGQTRAVRDVIAERRRQIEVEGWAPEHDDRHGAHELAEAAACYCLSSAGKPFDYFETMWPWERWWFKVSDPRRDLVKAGALVLAEIERLDRAAAQNPEGE